jgi:lipopolysaccharide cholinephosphotransferase
MMSIEPETRKGYHISTEMKKVWAVEMELLKKLLEVCKKHNLRIFAEGGTLLGAVREHGFIPWDDDIDMAMLRDDYDKLQEIAKN